MYVNITVTSNQNPFYYSKSGYWPTVGATLLNQQNKTFFSRKSCTTRAQRWPDVVQPTFLICANLYVGRLLALRCKSYKIKGTDFQFSSKTRWCWPNVVCPTPTINQRYNGLPTLAQRCHAILVAVRYLDLSL